MKERDYYINKFNSIPEHTGKWERTCEAKFRAIKPFNPISNVTYQGKNAVDLYLPLWEDSKLGYDIDLRFSTLKQIHKNGGSIKYNAKPFQIKCFTGNGYRSCEVYNYSDVIFPDNKYSEYAPHEYMFCPTHVVEKLFRNINVKVIWIANIQPSYVPHENAIYIPKYFKSDEKKYECMLHELVHWTKYNFPSCSRGLTYPQEECVAEYGMLMLYEELFGSAPKSIYENALDYIASWIREFPGELRMETIKESVDHAYWAVSKLMRFNED